jgi:hypothetical protein
MQKTERTSGWGAGNGGEKRALVERAKRCVPLLAAGVVMSVCAPARAQADGSAAAEEAVAAPAPPAAEPEAAPPPVGPHTANSLQLGLGFRYGIAMGSDSAPNLWGTGLGLDVGYTLPNGIYAGGNVEYFFGNTAEVSGFRFKGNVWQLSVEGGYDIGLGENFVIRPKVGFGVAGTKLTLEDCPPNVSCDAQGPSSDESPLVTPGAAFLLFTSHISLAVDVRYALVFGDKTAKALIFSFGVGL